MRLYHNEKGSATPDNLERLATPSCHSERSEESQYTAQDKLREAISSLFLEIASASSLTSFGTPRNDN